MAYSLNSSNFEKLKAKFREETGLDASKPENVGLYIQYFQAKTSDYQMQLLGFILEELGNLSRK